MRNICGLFNRWAARCTIAQGAKNDRFVDHYGCILGGHKGFVTQRMYPIFYAAFHPMLSMPERWVSGTVNQRTWRLWQLFEEKGTLNFLP
jgi:hypothetical protein